MAETTSSTDLAVAGDAPPGGEVAEGQNAAEGKAGRLDFLGNAEVLRQIALILGLAMALLVAVMVLVWSQEPEYRPLGQFDTDELIQTLDFLDQQKLTYKLEGNVIQVVTDQYQDIKLKLARAGLDHQPANGTDLLMKDMGFGVSQRLESERLKLAREQMLARTIEDLKPVAKARVLLALPRESVFATRTKKPGATVVVTLRRGQPLRQQEVDAIVDIVASAVQGMEPTRVTVTDQNGRLLNSGSQDPQTARNRREYELERQREQEYLDKIDNILIPVLGIGNYTAQVDVSMDFTQVEQTQRRFNPDLPALRSEMVIEDQRHGQQIGGIPGALSNQPPLESNIPQQATNAAMAQATTPSSSHKEATRNYELDQTVSHTRQQNGVMRRLSVSVAVDYKKQAGEGGQVQPQPRTEAELANIRRLLQGSLGFDVQRGDALEVVSVPFVSEPLGEPEPEPELWQQPWFWPAVKLGGAGLLALVMLLIVVRPLMRKLLYPEPEGGELAEAGLGGMDGGAMAQMSEEERLLLEDGSASSLLGGDGLLELGQFDSDDDMIEAVRAIVSNEPGIAARVLKSWMTEEDA